MGDVDPQPRTRHGTLGAWPSGILKRVQGRCTGGPEGPRRSAGRGIEGDLYRLDNTPWFAFGVAPDDVIEARPDADGVLWFRQVRERGGRIVVRVIPRDDGPLGGDRQGILDVFEPLGVGAEGMSSPVNMVALDIGQDAPMASA
ncbi:DUF4265 domain-containing protein [Humibacillus sp. DSM 29435]|uniref:DUF4265 domain-containing protein n=1 Tax=Humibacillus sp. DSM 29435 TaxID=1869167 RepID=UPI0009F4628D|nr:DUF4265 domain-containing protein [Humibacillus sp. DSM 29435]